MKKEYVFLASILGIKICLVFAVFFLFGEGRFMWADTQHYLTLGRNLIEGSGFGFYTSNGAVFSYTTEFMPLYPFLLGFFETYIPYGFLALSLLQAMAAAATAYFLYKLASFFVPSIWAMAAACLFSFEPLIAAIHLLLIPETLFMLFVTGFLYFFVSFLDRARNFDLYTAVFFLIGAAYTKPAALYLGFFAIVFLFVTKSGIRRIAVFASVVFLAFLPWMLRNNAVAGTYVLNTNGARNICSWGLGGITAAKYRVDSSDWNQIVYLPEFLETRARCTSTGSALGIFGTEYPKESFTMMTLSSLSILTNDGYTVFLEKPEEEQIKPHHNYLTPAVLVNADWAAKMRGGLQEFKTWELLLIGAGKLFWLLIAFGCLWGFVLSVRERQTRILALFLGIVVLYFLSASALAAGLAAGARYRYQIAGLLIVFAATGLYHMFIKTAIQNAR